MVYQVKQNLKQKSSLGDSYDNAKQDTSCRKCQNYESKSLQAQ